jgi:hypothetical protein
VADLGLWFKLWYAALDDPDMDNLDIADFGRWAKLGVFLKHQGTEGSLTLRPPAKRLCAALQVPDFDALMECLKRLPNVILRRENVGDNPAVSGETIAIVTFRNWMKYQGDFSTHRVRKYRSRAVSGETAKRRLEEKREEKTFPPSPTAETIVCVSPTPQPRSTRDPKALEHAKHATAEVMAKVKHARVKAQETTPPAPLTPATAEDLPF